MGLSASKKAKFRKKAYPEAFHIFENFRYEKKAEILTFAICSYLSEQEQKEGQKPFETARFSIRGEDLKAFLSQEGGKISEAFRAIEDALEWAVTNPPFLDSLSDKSLAKSVAKWRGINEKKEIINEGAKSEN